MGPIPTRKPVIGWAKMSPMRGAVVPSTDDIDAELRARGLDSRI